MNREVQSEREVIATRRVPRVLHGIVTAFLAVLVVSMGISSRRVDRRLSALEVRVKPEIDWSPMTERYLDVKRDLALCATRTTWLRDVLSVMVAHGDWHRRKTLPDPPPGWVSWDPVLIPLREQKEPRSWRAYTREVSEKPLK